MAKKPKKRKNEEGASGVARPWPLHHWRISPWIEDPILLTKKQRKWQEAALKILEDYNEKAVPFALFLRTFNVRQLYCHASDGGDGGDGICMEEHFWRQLRKIGANAIRIQDRDGAGEGTDNDVPALILKQEFWLVAVMALIHCAELIVSECLALGDGVRAELQACIDIGKTDLTVLILPSPPHQFVGNERDLADFPRAIHQFDIDLACPSRTIVFQDLLARMAMIAALNINTRMQLTQSMALKEEFPITYEGVAEGMLDIAKNYAFEKNTGALVFAGNRAALAAKASSGISGYVKYRIAVARLCEIAGDSMLAHVIIDEIETDIKNIQGGVTREEREEFLVLVRTLREFVIGKMLEPMKTTERAPELWRRANAITAAALERQDMTVLSQGFAWMCMAALLMRRYDQAIDHGIDAVSFGHISHNRYREAFAKYYLACAYWKTDQIPEAVVEIVQSVQMFPEKDKDSAIFASVALLYARIMEQVSEFSDAMTYYAIARALSVRLGIDEIQTDAAGGVKRLGLDFIRFKYRRSGKSVLFTPDEVQWVYRKLSSPRPIISQQWLEILSGRFCRG